MTYGNDKFQLNRPPHRFMNRKLSAVEKACEKEGVDKSKIRKVWSYDYQLFYVVDWEN